MLPRLVTWRRSFSRCWKAFKFSSNSTEACLNQDWGQSREAAHVANGVSYTQSFSDKFWGTSWIDWSNGPTRLDQVQTVSIMSLPLYELDSSDFELGRLLLTGPPLLPYLFLLDLPSHLGDLLLQFEFCWFQTLATPFDSWTATTIATTVIPEMQRQFGKSISKPTHRQVVRRWNVVVEWRGNRCGETERFPGNLNPPN